MALPQKWCIERTNENGAQINGYFNRLHNNPNGYEKKSGWMTNDTKRDVKGPFKEKPKGYEEISFETFRREVLKENGAPAARAVAGNALPEAWCVRGDGSQLMVQFAGLMNARFNVRWTGTSFGYYGYSENNYKSRYEKAEFGANVVEYTPQEIVNLLNNIPVAGANQVDIPQANNAGNIVANNGPVLVDYIIAKQWPGGPAVGTSVQLNGVVNLNNNLYGDAEFYTPVMKPVPANNTIVVLTRAVGNVPTGTYSVAGTNFSANRNQYFSRLRTREGNLHGTDISLAYLRDATPAEIQQFNGMQLHGLNVTKNVQTQTVRIGNTNVLIQSIRNLRSVKEADNADQIVINLRNVGNLTANNLRDLVLFYDAQ